MLKSSFSHGFRRSAVLATGASCLMAGSALLAQSTGDAPPSASVPRVVPPPVTVAPGAAPDAQRSPLPPTGSKVAPPVGKGGRVQRRGSTSTQGLGADLRKRTGVENRAQLAPSPELPENVITPDRPITTRDGETIPTLSDTAGLDSIFPSSNFGMDLTSSREGLVMGTVDPNSLAAQSGFLKGDVITAANDTMLSTQESLINVFNQHAAGDKITFKVVREGIPRRLTMTLPQAFVAETPPGGPESRTTLRPVLPTASAIDPEKLRPVNLGWAYRDTPEGLVIEDVSEGGFAATAGLQQGDLIETVDAVPVTSPVELIRELHRHSAGTLVPITVRRAGEPVNVNVQLPEESRTPLATDPSAPSAEVNDLQTLIQEVRALRVEVEALKQAQTPPPPPAPAN